MTWIADPLVEKCQHVLTEQRDRHPELRRVLTWNGVRAICRRLGIPIIAVPMPRPAKLIAPLGTPVILVDANTPPRRHTWFVAHELAHVFLGHACGEEFVFHLHECWPDDPREDEAEVLTTLMLGGPEFSRHF
jgi:Zn-dependent peptidase ImmA (M78 family)